MPNVMIPAFSSGSVIRRAVRPRVRVSSAARPDLQVTEWAERPGPAFGSALLICPSSRAGEFGRLPSIGARVRIDDGQCGFEGVVTRHEAIVAPDHDHSAARVEHVLAAMMATPVSGRWQLSDDAPVWHDDAVVRFNGPAGLASVELHDVAGQTVRLFEAGTPAQRWSVADMLAYLLAAHLPTSVSAANADELPMLAGDMYPDSVNTADLPLGDALVKVAGLAGLAVRAAHGGSSDPAIVFYRPGVDGRRRIVALGRPGQSLAGSNVHRANVRIAARSRAAGLTVIGSSIRYEVTVELKPGWDPAGESDRYRDFVRSQADDWPSVADVYRKWVLNESGRYDGSPVCASSFDCGTLDADAFFLRVGRPLGNCISADTFGASRGIVVEISLDDGESWARHLGPVLAASDECAIVLADDALPGEYFQAVVEGQARLRVTAAIQADRAVRVDIDGDPARPRRIVRAPWARLDKVHASSIFHQDELDPPPRDDSAALAALAAQLGARDGACDAAITLAWPDCGYGVGDLVESIAGRNVDLRSQPGFVPHIASLTHYFDDRWCSEMHIEG